MEIMVPVYAWSVRGRFSLSLRMIGYPTRGQRECVNGNAGSVRASGNEMSGEGTL